MCPEFLFDRALGIKTIENGVELVVGDARSFIFDIDGDRIASVGGKAGPARRDIAADGMLVDQRGLTSRSHRGAASSPAVVATSTEPFGAWAVKLWPEWTSAMRQLALA